MSMPHKTSGYQAYLLRLWLADNSKRPVWRLSLQQVGEQQPRYFHSVADFFAFIILLTEEAAAGEAERG